MIVDIDQVAPDIAEETGGGPRDPPHKCTAVYTEVYGVFFFAVHPVFVFAGPAGSVIFVFAAEFPEAVRVREICYFNL